MMHNLRPFLANYPLEDLPSGPWQEEPFYSTLFYATLPCVIMRAGLGHLCGYVGVPKEHPAFHAVGEDFSPHGGVTFQRENDNHMWFGFDCAHLGDLCPKLEHSPSNTGTIYRDYAFVKEEILLLARALSSYQESPLAKAKHLTKKWLEEQKAVSSEEKVSSFYSSLLSSLEYS